MIKVLVLILCFVSCVATQESSYAPQSAEKRVAQILETLEPSNTLRHALENGETGKGVHHAWMDKMQRLQIKQAAFVISFIWRNGIKNLKIRDVKFLRQYYRYDTQIKDQKTLREIQADQLEEDLRKAILIRAVEFVPNIMDNVGRTANAKPTQAHGTLYLNLLDDEILPILDVMPNVEWEK
jgi:hypothetical protein